MSKECTKCGETKPLDQMVRNARRSDGHDSECKECKRERSKRYYRQEPEKKRAYYLANYERISERESKRRKENPEKRRAYNLEYRRKNGDKIREKNREWRENNKAYIYEKNRVYRQENREHIQAWQRDHYEKNKERIRAMEKVRIEAWKKANPEKAARAAAERTARYNNHKKMWCQMGTRPLNCTTTGKQRGATRRFAHTVTAPSPTGIRRWGITFSRLVRVAPTRWRT